MGGLTSTSSSGVGGSGGLGVGGVGVGGVGVGGLGAGGAGGAAGGGTGSGGSPFVDARCGDAPPPGATMPPPPPAYSQGTCPALSAGVNQIDSGLDTRELILVLPTATAPGETFPVLFMWHWLGGSASSFLNKGEVQAAVDEQRFIAVIPEAKDSPLNFFKWPFAITDPDVRVQEELTFFDDMFACVSQQYPVDLACVSSVGVSAGALWTDQLVGHRGQYLASALSLSGGTGGAVIKPWTQPSHPLPMLVLWGGPSDSCIAVNFESTSHDLETHLSAGGHFFIECIHDCGHGEPPLEPPPGSSKYAGLWGFFLDHPYWLEAGQSPYLSGGLPASMPDWCGIGPASATPRQGPCEPPGCPF